MKGTLMILHQDPLAFSARLPRIAKWRVYDEKLKKGKR